MSFLSAYETSPVQIIPRWRYDLEKPAHIALATLGLLAILLLIGHTEYAFEACIQVAVAYFGVGKVLVAVGLIPHGSHKSLAQEACRWANEIGLCAFVPALIYGGLWAPLGAIALYVAAVAAEQWVVAHGY